MANQNHSLFTSRCSSDVAPLPLSCNCWGAGPTPKLCFPCPRDETFSAATATLAEKKATVMWCSISCCCAALTRRLNTFPKLKPPCIREPPIWKNSRLSFDLNLRPNVEKGDWSIGTCKRSRRYRKKMLTSTMATATRTRADSDVKRAAKISREWKN